jgi:hypothetical protein
LSVVVVLALALRAALMIAVGSRLPADPDNYLPLARSLAEGHGLTFNGRATAYRPPLYPIVLAPVLIATPAGGSIWPALAVLHLALGGATVVCTALAARGMELGKGRSLLAAGLVALDPLLAVLSRSIMTETLAAFLLSASIVAFAGRRRWSPLAGGCCLGLSALCRPSLLASATMCGLAAAVFGPRGPWARLLAAGSIALGVTLVLLPWGLRNARIFGTPVWTTTHGGYTLYLANNPVYYEEVVDRGEGGVWSGQGQRAWFVSLNEQGAGLSEPQADRLFTRKAIETILAHPRSFAQASLDRLLRFWAVAPSGAVYSAWERWMSAAWTIPFWLLVAAGACRRSQWTWPAVVCQAIVVGLTLVHVFFWTDLRMRAPLIPALALIAARGWAGRNGPGAGRRQGPGKG